MKKSVSDSILRVLKRGPKRGLTAATIAERGELNLNTTRTTLVSLVSAGIVDIVSCVTPEGRGRPAHLYVISDAS